MITVSDDPQLIFVLKETPLVVVYARKHLNHIFQHRLLNVHRLHFIKPLIYHSIGKEQSFFFFTLY